MSRGDGIKPINNLFEKYKHTLRAPQASVVKVFIEVVQDVLEITLKEDWVAYNTYQKIITLKAPGPIATEIKRQQEIIITHLKGRLGEKSAPKTIR